MTLRAWRPRCPAAHATLSQATAAGIEAGVVELVDDYACLRKAVRWLSVEELLVEVVDETGRPHVCGSVDPGLQLLRRGSRVVVGRSTQRNRREQRHDHLQPLRAEHGVRARLAS